ncbi:uncharacterized protein LOC125179131 [Hyalella azteca]|uniref:Uncharacterized protein LOC125179131 n=1 Tax=Hyalella azteca TaxID=294128 RepID=A0A979FV85_HYAAZ|nr:uncharacterized protein LOC125179131 [Hyalella azteca]
MQHTIFVTTAAALLVMMALGDATGGARYNDCSSICHRTGIIGRFAGCRCSLTLFTKRAMGEVAAASGNATPDGENDPAGFVELDLDLERDHHPTPDEPLQGPRSSGPWLSPEADNTPLILPYPDYDIAPAENEFFGSRFLKENKDAVGRFVRDRGNFQLKKRFAARLSKRSDPSVNRNFGISRH